MSMRINTQLAILESKKNAIINIHMRMVKEHWSHAKYLEERVKIWDSIPKKFPRHYWEYIRGYMDSLMQSLYIDKIEWKHADLEGNTYKNWLDMPASIRYNEKNYTSNHYWKDSKDIFS